MFFSDMYIYIYAYFQIWHQDLFPNSQSHAILFQLREDLAAFSAQFTARQRRAVIVM